MQVTWDAAFNQLITFFWDKKKKFEKILTVMNGRHIWQLSKCDLGPFDLVRSLWFYIDHAVDCSWLDLKQLEVDFGLIRTSFYHCLHVHWAGTLDSQGYIIRLVTVSLQEGVFISYGSDTFCKWYFWWSAVYLLGLAQTLPQSPRFTCHTKKVGTLPSRVQNRLCLAGYIPIP